MKKINSIIPTKLYAILDENYLFIDLRNKTDYNYNHLKNFKNIPSSHLLKEIHSFSVLKPIILLCYTGYLSNYYAPILAQKGFYVYVIAGGMHAVLHPLDDSVY